MVSCSTKLAEVGELTVMSRLAKIPAVIEPLFVTTEVVDTMGVLVPSVTGMKNSS